MAALRDKAGRPHLARSLSGACLKALPTGAVIQAPPEGVAGRPCLRVSPVGVLIQSAANKAPPRMARSRGYFF